MEFFDQTFFTEGDDVSVSPDNVMVSTSDFGVSSFTAVNQSARDSPTGTVSPTDLSLEPSLTMSAPSSTAFPNLSTPGTNPLESPFWDMAGNSSSLDTSPMHPDGQLDAALDGDWASAPLFSNDPQLDPFAASQMGDSVIPGYTAASPMVRQKSGGSPGRPVGSGRKHSDVAGVKAASKSRKPLPEIVIAEEDDKDIAKRKKNTAAARKSRERKLEKAMEAETEISRLNDLIKMYEANVTEQQAQIAKYQQYIIAIGGDVQQATSF